MLPQCIETPVLDVPGDQDKVGGGVFLILAGVVVGRITGGRSCNHCRWVEGGGGWEGVTGVVCYVVWHELMPHMGHEYGMNLHHY